MSSSRAAETKIRLSDATAENAIEFRHTDGSSGGYHIVETTSAGLALIDYDQDGDLDIYFLNGAPQPDASGATPSPEEAPANALYRNDGDWRFTDVTAAAGVGDVGHGLGVAVGDYDNDGDPDIYLNNYGPNILYRNNGDGTFTNVAEQAGVSNGARVGAGATFVDIDADGDLDLYVANYVKYPIDDHVIRTRQGFPVYRSPLDHAPDPDTLFRNNGDGTFTDVSDESGIARTPAYGMGLISADYDNDGDADIFVGNDTGPNFLFNNDGSGRFEDVALWQGFAYDGLGASQGTMGVDCADADNDGLLDVHATSYQHEYAPLYKNEGEFFADVTVPTRAGLGTTLPVTWGNALVDLDNDGDRDIFIACGHVHDLVDRFDSKATYQTPNTVLENLGDGTFADVSGQCGDGLEVKRSSRGAAVGDLDGDGDQDVVILNTRSKPTFLRNDSARGNHWLDVRLKSERSNGSAIGARVEVVAGELVQIDEVHSGRGFQSDFGHQLHFGLSEHRRIDEIRIRWPVDSEGNRQEQVIRDVAADQVLTVEQQR